MLTTGLIYPFLALGMIVLGWALYRRQSHWPLTERWMLAGLPSALFVAAMYVLHEALLAPLQIWDTVHLLPAYLLADGRPIYYPADAGPILDMMYGPMTAVAYWPVTVLTRHPGWAAGFAKFLTVFYFVVPGLFLALTRRAAGTQRLMVAYAFLAYLYFVFQSASLSGAAFWIHADAPALCWAGLGCAFIYLRGDANQKWVFSAAGLCISLSLWTKQVTFPLVAAVPLYLWAAEGPRSAARFVAWFALWAVLTSGLFVAWHGLEELRFNLVVNPSLQPWHKDLIKAEGWAVVELMERMRWPIIALFFYAIYEWRSGRISSVRGWLRDSRWSLFVVAALCMVPTALMGRMRMGGDLNALAFCTFFLITAIYLIVLDCVTRHTPDVKAAAPKRFLAKLLVLYTLSSMLLLLPTLSYYFICLPKYLARLQTNPAHIAYTFSKAHPGLVYMPWNCLETYLAEGRAYHFEYAVFDRELGGLPPTATHFASALPEGMRYVAYPFNEQARHVMKLFPEYRFEGTLPELPGWTVYSRDDAEGSKPAHPEDADSPDRRQKKVSWL